MPLAATCVEIHGQPDLQRQEVVPQRTHRQRGINWKLAQFELLWRRQLLSHWSARAGSARTHPGSGLGVSEAHRHPIFERFMCTRFGISRPALRCTKTRRVGAGGRRPPPGETRAIRHELTCTKRSRQRRFARCDVGSATMTRGPHVSLSQW